jgi:hypothetical protein
MNRPRAAEIVLDEHSLNLPRPHQASPGPMWAKWRALSGRRDCPIWVQWATPSAAVRAPTGMSIPLCWTVRRRQPQVYLGT